MKRDKGQILHLMHSILQIQPENQVVAVKGIEVADVLSKSHNHANTEAFAGIVALVGLIPHGRIKRPVIISQGQAYPTLVDKQTVLRTGHLPCVRVAVLHDIIRHFFHKQSHSSGGLRTGTILVAEFLYPLLFSCHILK